jgi:hypothetical protein
MKTRIMAMADMEGLGRNRRKRRVDAGFSEPGR